MAMEPGTPSPSTSGPVSCTSQSGQKSTPTRNAMAPPTVSFPNYPSLTLNNYYRNPTPLHHNVQNNPHIFAPASSEFYDTNVLPPSTSQTHVPSIRRTPSTPFCPISTNRSLPNHHHYIFHSLVNNHRDILDHVPISPLIFHPPLFLSPQNDPYIQNNSIQSHHHSIISPQVLTAPTPVNTYSPSFHPHSVSLPIPNIAAPQPLQPIFPFTQHLSPSLNSSYIPHTSQSNHSRHSSSSRASLKISLPNTKDIPLLTGKHDWGPWHSAVSSLILCSNLFSHIADDILPGAAYDPDLWLTYPPILQPNSKPEAHHEFSQWWSRDGITTYILTS